MNCRDLVAEDIVINGSPLDPNGTHELATNNYIAHGGSGFSMLERNTTQFDTGISIRDVVRAAITNNYTLPKDTDGDGEEDVCVEDGRILPSFRSDRPQEVENTEKCAAFIRATLANGVAVGSEEEPPVPSEESSAAIAVEVLDHNGELLDFNGTLARHRPGSLTGTPYISATNGTWSGFVVSKRFPPNPNLVTDSPIGGENVPSSRQASVSPCSFESQQSAMNRTDDHETNQLDKEFAEIRVDDRNVRVTAVGTSGFWVSDSTMRKAITTAFSSTPSPSQKTM